MISFPVIERELRVQARRPATYYGRLGWGLAAVVLLAIIVSNDPQKSADGKYVLAIIHGSLAVMLLLLGPIIASDSISRERREGTLGLLLLTPLTPRQIVLGKLAAHFFRLFYLWLMMVPFMMLPVLLGGVGLDQFLLSVAVLFSILVVGVSAGMIASAPCVQFGIALVWALILSSLANLAISSLAVNGPALFLKANANFKLPFLAEIFLLAPALIVTPGLLIEFYLQRVFASRFISLITWTAMISCSMLFFLFAIRFCSRRIAQQGESTIETKGQAAFRRRFLTPIFWKSAFHRAMGRTLDRNPFVWLEYRAAWSRAARWAAVLVLISVETMMVITNPGQNDFVTAQFYILCVLVLLMTLKSSSSFQREKESGAFELILVTPFTEAKLVAGRLRAVASYYSHVIVTLALFSLLALWLFEEVNYELGPVLMFVSLWLSLLSVPATGLFFALRCKAFFPALLWTIGLGILGAPILWGCFSGVLWFTAYRLDNDLAVLLDHTLRDVWWPPLLATILYHFVLAHLCRRSAMDILRRRAFGCV